MSEQAKALAVSPFSKAQLASKPKWLAFERLDQMIAAGAHVLIPNQHQAAVSSVWKPVLEVVFISPDVKHKEVWQLPGSTGKYGLSKIGLLKIARAAGVQLLPSTVVAERDGFIRVQASVKQRNSSGEWEYGHGTKHLDRQQIQADNLSKAMAKIGKEGGPKDESEAIAKATADTDRIWLFHEERAETGAYLRAVRAMLTIRGDYNLKELEKPFIVRAIHFAPDTSNPQAAAAEAAYLQRVAERMSEGGDGPPLADFAVRTGRTVVQVNQDADAWQAMEREAKQHDNEPPPSIEEWTHEESLALDAQLVDEDDA